MAAFFSRCLARKYTFALALLAMAGALCASAVAQDDSSSIVLPSSPPATAQPAAPRPAQARPNEDAEPPASASSPSVPNPTVPPNPASGSALTFAPSTQADPALSASPVPLSGGTCALQLHALGALFTQPGPVEGRGACGIENTVRLEAVGGVALRPAATLACPTAVTFAQFLRDSITPQLALTLNTAPQTVHVAASYACRGRNNNPNARLSEHSFGRAIDVRAITLANGEQWNVMPRTRQPSASHAAFQQALREASCGPFKTVLGPGSDGHHQDHLHLDVAQRQSTYCR